MIIAECQVRVPSRKYSLSINCTKTRRLTAIEWLVLSCVQKFHESQEMSRKTLKDVFESVLDLQDSSLLIKPSVEALKKLDVLQFDVAEFNYESTAFGSIGLTETGKQMLSDGLLPGEKTEFNREVWYNPLTGQLNSQEIPRSNPMETTVFGSREEYGDLFPVEEIKRKLQSGELGAEKFSASEYIINSIDKVGARDTETFITLLYDVDNNNQLTISPDIVSEKMRKKVDELLFYEGVTKESIKTFVPVNKTSIDSIIGSGLRIKEALLNVCRNGHILFMNERSYNYISMVDAEKLKNKMIIIFESDRLDSRIENESIVLSIPVDYDIPGCAIINDKNESVSLCKAVMEYDGRKIDYPLALIDKRVTSRPDNVIQWLRDEILRNAKRDVSYYGIFATPVLLSESKHLIDALSSLWKNKPLDGILSDILRMTAIPNRIYQDPLDLTPLFDLLLEKVNPQKADRGLSDYQRIIQSPGIKKGSKLHVALVEKALAASTKPSSYTELQIMIQRLGIDDHDVALLFDEFFDPLYDKAVVRDILREIMEGKDPIKENLFAMDEYFSNYVMNLNQIALLIGRKRTDLFKSMDSETLRKSVINCPNVALLQSYVAELSDCNADLLKREINIYSLMTETDNDRASKFYNNLNLIDRFLVEKIKGIIPIDLEPVSQTKKDEPERIDAKVYIIDTCTMIDHPDIFLYFAKDEYVRIPLKVIDELGKIKDKRFRKYDPESTSLIARQLSKEIKEYLKEFNVMNNCALMISKADTKVLPMDLDHDTPDYLILSVALRYKDWNVCLVTEDNQFSIVAKSMGIKTMAWKDFIKEHKHNFCAKNKLRDKYMEFDMPSTKVLEWISKNAEQEAYNWNE